MLGTELLKGQGLGNQLFCYITTRCLALRSGYEFSILGREILGNDVYSQKGLYFMDLDLGGESTREDYKTVCQEREDRLFLPNSAHDMTHGAYITGTDEALMALPDNTLVGGNMQAQDYFRPYKQEIKEWLRVKPEFDSYEYSRDNLCILNLRGGEYTSDPALYLRRKYWVRAMAQMRRIRADMEFLIVTDDVEAAKKLLPELPAVHGSLHEDYTHIKNAKYLILSNSSFAFFPAYTSETLHMAIAPKYWARHNVSDGYWASEQNIYDEFTYMDRRGRLFSAEECRRELEQYKQKSSKYKKRNERPTGIRRLWYLLRVKAVYAEWWMGRIVRSMSRRLVLWRRGRKTK